MNIKDIAALAEIVKQNELTKLEINGENIVIERAAQVVQAAPILNAVQPAVPEQMHTTEPIAEVKEKEGVLCKKPCRRRILRRAVSGQQAVRRRGRHGAQGRYALHH